MDIFAHALWTGAVYRLGNTLRRKKSETKRLSIRVAAFWGVAPDLFAFSHVFIFLTVGRILGFAVPDFGSPGYGEPPHNGYWFYTLAQQLYNWSHSAVIFVLVFAAVWLIFRRPYYELGGWLLHVLIDVPTHSYDFYPTPVLWPISEWRFQYGISWGEPWFLKINYLALAVVYGYILGKFLYRKLFSGEHG